MVQLLGNRDENLDVITENLDASVHVRGNEINKTTVVNEQLQQRVGLESMLSSDMRVTRLLLR